MHPPSDVKFVNETEGKTRRKNSGSAPMLFSKSFTSYLIIFADIKWTLLISFERKRCYGLFMLVKEVDFLFRDRKFGRMLLYLRRLPRIQRVMFLFRCAQLFCLKQERASKYSKSSRWQRTGRKDQEPLGAWKGEKATFYKITDIFMTPFRGECNLIIFSP